jgi:mono/diheme cytochrome c family protein
MNRAILLPVICLALAGCGSESPTEGEGTSGGEVSYEGPVASMDTVGGEAVFQQFCNGCHPGGNEGRGPALVNENEPAAEVREQVREGGGQMPGFGEDRIDAMQLEALLAYLQTIGAVAANDAVAMPEGDEGGEAGIE